MKDLLLINMDQVSDKLWSEKSMSLNMLLLNSLRNGDSGMLSSNCNDAPLCSILGPKTDIRKRSSRVFLQRILQEALHISEECVDTSSDSKEQTV
jgi:hypothetical protein